MKNISIENTFLFKSFLNVRKQTLKLVKGLSSEDMVIQTDSFVSPIKWHLAHTTWFFEHFILKNFQKYKIFDKSFDYIFNSYYYSVGKFNPKDMRGYLNRPEIEKIFQYRSYVEKNIFDLLLKLSLTPKKKKLFIIGINHEQQHQELILMDILNIFFKNPLKPQFIKKKKINGLKKCNVTWKNEKKIKFEYGTNTNDTFAYDNESPTGYKELLPFQVDYDFVSNNEWREFIDSNGYKRPELWLSDGWEFINKYKINKPMYWIDQKYQFCLTGIERIDNDQPVSHISYYEADAFCRFRKRRMPTEFEMEFFLKKNKKEGNFLENGYYKPINSFFKNKYNGSYGNLWSWTSSNYVPYNGYKPFEGNLGEYNKKFMCNQFVLKGGSFATPKSHIRASYRNFYYPSDRWQFSGLRLASDI
jgi:ergothioneine biosynthesis protein EgtB